MSVLTELNGTFTVNRKKIMSSLEQNSVQTQSPGAGLNREIDKKCETKKSLKQNLFDPNIDINPSPEIVGMNAFDIFEA